MTAGWGSLRSRRRGRRVRHSGDIRVGEDYGSDQYSQIVVTSTQLTAGSGSARRSAARTAVRTRYLGMYFWNDGNPQLALYKRTDGTWVQLGSSDPVAPLPAGTVLTLVAVGSQISFVENGVAADHRDRRHDHRRRIPAFMTFGRERRQLDRRRRHPTTRRQVFGRRDRVGPVWAAATAGQRAVTT